MTVKTSISLKEDVFNDGQDKANSLFSGNFSAYIGFLICKDRIQKELPTRIEKDSRFKAAVSSILDM